MKKFLSLYSTLGAVMFLSMSVSNTASAFSFDSPVKVRYDTNLIDAMTKANKECYARMVKKGIDLESEKSLLEEQNEGLAAERSALRSENESLRSENEDLTTENESLRSENEDLTTQNSTLRSESERLNEELTAAIREKNIERIRRLLSAGMSKLIQDWYNTVLGKANDHKAEDNYSAIVAHLGGYRAILEDSMRDLMQTKGDKSELEKLISDSKDPKENEALMSHLNGILDALKSQCAAYTVDTAVKALSDLPGKLSGAQAAAKSLFGS